MFGKKYQKNIKESKETISFEIIRRHNQTQILKKINLSRFLDTLFTIFKSCVHDIFHPMTWQ